MNITRDVITDLLPLYLAGEASADSNVLIKKFLEIDPDFAQIILSSDGESESEQVLLKQKIQLESDFELTALSKTKRLINLRSWLMGLAIFFTASLFGIRNVGNGIEWIWSGFLIGFAICLAVSLCSWIFYFIVQQRLIKVGV